MSSLRIFIACLSALACAELRAAAAQVDAPADTPALFDQLLNLRALVDDIPGDFAWSADGAGLWYRSGGLIRLIEPGSGDERARLDEAALRRALRPRFGELSDAPLPLRAITSVDADAIHLRWLETDIRVSRRNGAVDIDEGARPVPPGSFPRALFMMDSYRAPDIVSNDGSRVLSIVNGNIVVRKPGSPEHRSLTTDAQARFGWDLASGRMNVANLRAAHTTPWSPDDGRIFAMQVDRRHMPTFPEVHLITKGPPEIIQHDSISAGGPHYIYHPVIVDASTGEITRISADGIGSDFLLLLDWNESGDTVWFGAVDRAGRRIRIFAADAETGQARLVLTEPGKRGLPPIHQVHYSGNIGFKLLGGKRGFLWQSQRYGWNQLYHFDVYGKRVRRIAKGRYPVDAVEFIDPDSGRVYFSARSDQARPYDVHLHSVALSGGPVIQHTHEPGVHRVTFSPGGRYFTDLYSSPSSPPALVIRPLNDGAPTLVAKTGIDRLIALGWQPPLEFVVKAGDGKTDVHGVMYRPFEFDEHKRYPIIEDIYGGHFLIKGDHEFLLGMTPGENFPLALAQQGFVVVRFDTPGTVGRSRAFGEAVKRKWGAGVIADHAAVIRNLAGRYAFVDGDSVGVYGHSWGGYYALMALALEAGTYDAAVATAPGVFYDDYYDAFMEYYLGAPADYPKAWTRADLMPLLDRIDKPLLLGVGIRDYFLYPATLRIHDALIRRGFQHEIMLAPTMGHGIYGPYEAYFIDKTTRFFVRSLKTPDEAGDRGLRR